MYNKQSQSLIDYLMLVVKDMPSLEHLKLHFKAKGTDPSAKKLYSLWSDTENKIADRKFRRPSDMTEADVRSLERSGLVEIHGKDMRVTARGVVALRQMILDDDEFHLSKKAESSLVIKTASAKGYKNWYTRMLDEDIVS